MADNIKVAIKVRPLIKREKENQFESQWEIKENTIVQSDGGAHEPFRFGKLNIFLLKLSKPCALLETIFYKFISGIDHIYTEDAATRTLFDEVCKPIIENCIKGINGTILAYGQTSSGKTYTMTGTDNEPGVTILAVRQIFNEIQRQPDRFFLLRIAYIEIYNEKIFDLLDPTATSEVKIRDTALGDVRVSCFEYVVNSPEHIINYMLKGNATRRMAETNMNERSSRSHTIFRIMIESRQMQTNTDDDPEESPVQISTLNLVDLAGSERADQTGATGSRLKEGSYINKSLLSLGLVIKQLSDSQNNERYINYRDSKLTRILQSSIGGNSMTAIICTVTPAVIEETNYTLLFAMRAKTIKNKPKINESVSEATTTRRLLKEIKRLKMELDRERQKKNNLNIVQLQKDITERQIQFIGSTRREVDQKARRRTWCTTPSLEQISEDVECLYSRPSGLIVNNVTVERGSLSPVDLILPPEFDCLEELGEECGENMKFFPTEIKTPECMKRKQKIKSISLAPIRLNEVVVSPHRIDSEMCVSV